MKLVNLTPHSVVLCDGQGTPVVTVPPTGSRLECEPVREVVGTVAVDGHEIPITVVRLGELRLVDLATKAVGTMPAAEEGTFLLVSRISAEKAKVLGREDCLVPDDTVRDAGGRVMGCKALARV